MHSSSWKPDSTQSGVVLAGCAQLAIESRSKRTIGRSNYRCLYLRRFSDTVSLSRCSSSASFTSGQLMRSGMIEEICSIDWLLYITDYIILVRSRWRRSGIRDTLLKSCRTSSRFMGTMETIECITSCWFTSLYRRSAFISLDSDIYAFTGNQYVLIIKKKIRY